MRFEEQSSKKVKRKNNISGKKMVLWSITYYNLMLDNWRNECVDEIKFYLYDRGDDDKMDMKVYSKKGYLK